MKNINITLIGVSLLALTFSFKVNAQSCTTPPTCAELGYTKSSSDCATSSLKCPFDQSKYFCLTAGEIADLTPSKCAIGDILYSDKSCNANVVASKTPIGVVFDITNRLAIALNDDYKTWSDEIFDIPDLTNKTTTEAVAADWQGKNNTATILKYCQDNSKNCPAFEYVNTYSTTGTNTGSWHLPAGGELNAIYQNKDVIETALTKVNGSSLASKKYWTSTEKDNYGAWYRSSDSNFSTYTTTSAAGGSWYCGTKRLQVTMISGSVSWASCNINKIYVRPVLAF